MTETPMEDETTLSTKRKHTEKSHKSRKRFRSSSSISDLPNCIIQHILDLLPVKDAIKFCSLSRHWVSFWKSISNLFFHCEKSFKLKDVNRFASFVDKSLKVYASSNIKKFSLKIYYNRYLKKKTESWLCFATSHKLEELCLDFTPSDSTLPIFDLGRRLESTCWMSLKILSLTGASFGSETIRAILQGSLLIESLTLRDCVFYDSTSRIDARSTSLKELVIDGCKGSIFRRMNISAPSLLSLTIVGYFHKIMQNLLDVSSLNEATISLKSKRHGVLADHEKEMLNALLEKLTHISKLAIGIESLQVLSIMRLDGEIIPTLTCRSLKVEMKLHKRYLPGIEALLHSSPYLEQLIMNVSPHACDESIICRITQSVEENYWRSETRNFSCLNKNLRRVEVIGFVPGHVRWSRNQILVETIHFLLDNAKVLQKLIVHARLDKQNRLLEIKEKILSHPRASPNAHVEFMFP